MSILRDGLEALKKKKKSRPLALSQLPDTSLVAMGRKPPPPPPPPSAPKDTHPARSYMNKKNVTDQLDEADDYPR